MFKALVGDIDTNDPVDPQDLGVIADEFGGNVGSGELALFQ